MQFLESARELYVINIRYCENLPKKHYHYLQEPYSRALADMLTYLKMGNSIYPTNETEAQLRREYFLKAYASLQAAVSFLGIIQDMGLLTERQITYISCKMSEELKLIKGILKTDKTRF